MLFLTLDVFPEKINSRKIKPQQMLSFWANHLHFSVFQRLPLQLHGVLVSAHGSAGSPRGHSLGTFHHVPPQPSSPTRLLGLQLAVALGVGRLGTEVQPARGAVFQRLHALLRESSKAEPQPWQWAVWGKPPWSIGSGASCVSVPCGGHFLLLWSQQEDRNPKDNGPVGLFCDSLGHGTYNSLTHLTISVSFMALQDKHRNTWQQRDAHEQLFLFELQHSYHAV